MLLSVGSRIKSIGISSFDLIGCCEKGERGRLGGSLIAEAGAEGVNCGIQGHTCCNSANFKLLSLSLILLRFALLLSIENLSPLIFKLVAVLGIPSIEFVIRNRAACSRSSRLLISLFSLAFYNTNSNEYS